MSTTQDPASVAPSQPELQSDDPIVQIALIVLFTVTGIPACGGLERRYGEDPKQATADEAAGQALTLLMVPMDWITIGMGFFLFRVFDVLKPPPARKLESLHGGLGIVADDLAAGVYARITLELWIRFAAPVLIPLVGGWLGLDLPLPGGGE